MAIRYEASHLFKFSKNDVVITIDDTAQTSVTKRNLVLDNVKLEAGRSSRTWSDSIISRLTGTTAKVYLYVDKSDIAWFRTIKKRQAKINIVKNGKTVFVGWILPAAFKSKYNPNTKLPLKLNCTDGFHDLTRITFTPDDYASFADVNNLSSNTLYTDSGTHMGLAEFVSEAILKATGSRRAYWVASDIADFRQSGNQFANFAEAWARKMVPVDRLFGKTWGKIFDEEICQRWNMKWSTYNNQYCLINIPEYGKSSFTMYEINDNGGLDNTIAAKTINRFAVNENHIYYETQDEGNDVLQGVNVHTFRGHNETVSDLSEDEMVNGDIELSGPDEAAGWSERTIAGTYDGFTFLSSGGYTTVDDQGDPIGNDNSLAYTLSFRGGVFSRTALNNPNNVQRYRGCQTGIVGRFRNDGLGALLSYAIRTNGDPANYDIAVNPAGHKLIIVMTEIDQTVDLERNADGTVDPTNIATGVQYSYDIGQRSWHLPGSGGWEDGAIGIVNDVDTPFNSDGTWTIINRSVYNIPTSGFITVWVSNPVFLQGFSIEPTRTMICYYDFFRLRERQARRGDTSGYTRTVVRTDVEGEITHDTPIFESSTAIPSQYVGATRNWRLSSGALSLDATNGYRIGFYGPTDVSSQVNNLAESSLEVQTGKQLITQTAGNPDLFDLEIPISTHNLEDTCRGLEFLSGSWAIQHIEEDYAANRAEVTILHVNDAEPPYSVSETLNEVQTASGSGRSTITFAEADGLNYVRAESEEAVQALRDSGQLVPNTLYGIGEESA